MAVDLSRFQDSFFTESAEHVETIESGLLALEQRPNDLDLLNRIFRGAHSIKGNAGMFHFTAIAESAQAAGFIVSGYTTQAYFLMSSGLDQLVAASDPDDVAAHMALVQGVKRLTLPTEMGERFKVLGLTKEWDQPLTGFAMRDMRERL